MDRARPRAYNQNLELTIQFVWELARQKKSTELAQLLLRMASALHSGKDKDSVTKEKGLISTMIERLEGEMGADATEKSFCKKELSETNI